MDVLLCNAGISGSPSPEQSFGKLDYDLFDSYLRTNALGPLKMAEAFLENIESGQLKTIAVLSSKAGSFAERERAAPDTYFYRASKAALNMFMVQVAANVRGRGIKVVLLSPGMVDTSGGTLTEMNEKYKLGLTIIPVEKSVEGMIDRIDSTSIADSGKIFSYSGEQVGY